MRLTFTNTLDDWTAAQAYEVDRMPRYQDAVHAWKWGLAVGLGLLCTWAAATVSHSTGGGFVMGGLVGVWLFFWYPGHVRARYLAGGRAQLNVAESRPFLECERTLEVTEEGLRTSSPAGANLVRWIFLRSVEETATHIFVRFKYGLGLAIPKRDVSPEEAAAFVSGVRQRIVAPPR